MPLPRDLPADPFSREYRDRQMAVYGRLSGCGEYLAEVCEQTEITPDNRQRPYPYWTGSATAIGEHLMAMGFLIRAGEFKPRQRVVEFGPGLGRLTLEFARMGADLTAVEINPLYVELIREHALREDLRVDVRLAGMLDYEPPERFDRVCFFECFHHCADHAAMVARLDALVAPGGSVVFAGEPIVPDFPIPWGVRHDGRSLWAVRNHRWLELGFRTDYFLDLLKRHGWWAKVHSSVDVPWCQVFVARRAAEVK